MALHATGLRLRRPPLQAVDPHASFASPSYVPFRTTSTLQGATAGASPSLVSTNTGILEPRRLLLPRPHATVPGLQGAPSRFIRAYLRAARPTSIRVSHLLSHPATVRSPPVRADSRLAVPNAPLLGRKPASPPRCLSSLPRTAPVPCPAPMSMQDKNLSFVSVSEGSPGGTCVNAGSHQEEESAAHSEAMSESPPADEMIVSQPAQEEKDGSLKSFEFLPPRDPATKSADGGSASTPKMQRVPSTTIVKAAPATSTCVRSTLKIYGPCPHSACRPRSLTPARAMAADGAARLALPPPRC